MFRNANSLKFGEVINQAKISKLKKYLCVFIRFINNSVSSWLTLVCVLLVNFSTQLHHVIYTVQTLYLLIHLFIV